MVLAPGGCHFGLRPEQLEVLRVKLDELRGSGVGVTVTVVVGGDEPR